MKTRSRSLRVARALSFVSTVLLTCTAAPLALADDGAITNKSMSRTIEPPLIDYGQAIVNAKVRETEHAFTDMMGFYVPAQAASGLVYVDGIPYCDIDNQPAPGEDCTSPVETLEVAKPLVNVFLYGPQFEVPETAFAHRFFDTWAAVSLDDGETWKQTNLSRSATLSSFNIETDHRDRRGEPLPGDHNIRLGNALHARGYDTPYSSECVECHGVGLQGVAEVPSCYSCHDQKWSEPTPVETGPIIYMAEYQRQTKPGGSTKLKIEGTNAPADTVVTILNAITEEVVGTTEALPNGIFSFDDKYTGGSLPPCVVMAEYTDQQGEVLVGPTLTVKDKKTGEPIENCAGQPVNITDYPGGTYNVFHATAGNKTLVAWPSRFCQRGQPAYQMTTPTDPDLERLAAVTAFIQNGDAELGVPALPGFSNEDDLYLVDAFNVAGSQGSIDFADEGYPQAGVVPFGCLWTARGVLRPGDDPRTDEVESSHMVWTNAERLTSGRRDVNRIEVKAVKGAGFAVTWQEDPEGLRPGQGLGPGEGWSGAVAHSQTDMWYSFINEEYFDIVEDPASTTTPVHILDHDLTVTGRPQVFVPMAVPMRVSNNAKCNPASVIPPGGADPALYCDYELAAAYGLKDQCADTVTII
ncbi:MAG: choice-of-anchor O protein, partial [Thiohalobacterales bacterium]|nr:choice-of-anchor O protein [Thiohalobacterales bacterium]